MIQSIACVLLALVVLAIPRGVEGKPADDRARLTLSVLARSSTCHARPRVAFERAET